MSNSKRKILFNGCSFTYGHGLKEDEGAYPYWVGNDLDAEVINVGMPAASNDHIFRTTMTNLWQHKDITDLVVMWSDWNRVEFINTDVGQGSYSFQRANLWNKGLLKEVPKGTVPGKERDTWIYMQSSPARLRQSPWRFHYWVDAWEGFYGSIWQTSTGVLKTGFQTLMLQDYCKTHNIKFHHTLFSRKMLSQLQHMLLNATSEGQFMVQQEWNTIKREMDNPIDINDDQMYIDQFVEEFGSCDDQGHPNARAHKEYGLYLAARIDK
jgi:hypothetical protein|tara:strand:- start:1011 stop:1811 length:801 start_codon:yes stop_codon:yes gene_type:complete